LQYNIAATSDWAWLYCIDSTKPHPKKGLGDWQYAKYENSEELKPDKDFVSPYQDWFYRTGGVVIRSQNFYFETQPIPKKMEDNRPNLKKSLTKKMIMTLKSLDAIVNHPFKTVD
jgi:hypothetical protein